MAYLFEVRAVRRELATATKWKIVSEDLIDTDIYCIINSKIKEFKLVSTTEGGDGVFIYEIWFYRAFDKEFITRMFPGCFVEVVRQIIPKRIYVTYERETNSYIPFDDPSM